MAVTIFCYNLSNFGLMKFKNWFYRVQRVVEATNLNRCVLSKTKPHTTEPNIPARTIDRPILPASSAFSCIEK